MPDSRTATPRNKEKNKGEATGNKKQRTAQRTAEKASFPIFTPYYELTDEQRPYYNYTCQPGDFIKTCSVPSPLLNEKDLEREKRMLEI